MTKEQFMKIGKLLLRREAARKEGERISEELQKLGSYTNCYTSSDTAMEVGIDLGQYCSTFQDELPSLKITEGKRGHLEYPAKCVVEIVPGRWLWVKAYTPSFDLPHCAHKIA